MADAHEPPADLTRDEYLVWRAPRWGAFAAEDLTNRAWAWLARSPALSAYEANAHFSGPSSMAVGPAYCGQRFGQSKTTLSDGRTFAIGGEHEDHYDPDFFIYNDVTIFDASGEVRIYGYPTSTFPPTDFHSATLIDDEQRIALVGCLGHPRDRVHSATPVFVLGTEHLGIDRIETRGGPGWIFGHAARLSGRTLVVSLGKRMAEVAGAEHVLENVDDWALDLDARCWERLTMRPFSEWSLARATGRANDLFSIGSMQWHAVETTDFDRERLAQIEARLGRRPDLSLYASLYRPSDDHAVEPSETEYPAVARIRIDGFLVRFVESHHDVRVVIEGALESSVAQRLLEELREKLERLEETPYTLQRLQ